MYEPTQLMTDEIIRVAMEFRRVERPIHVAMTITPAGDVIRHIPRLRSFERRRPGTPRVRQ